jgi:hypothetical protein
MSNATFFLGKHAGQLCGEPLAKHEAMERADVLRMADGVLREYGVPMKVAGVAPAGAGWTVAFSSTFPGAPALEVRLQCERTSTYHVRESLKRSLALTD